MINFGEMLVLLGMDIYLMTNTIYYLAIYTWILVKNNNHSIKTPHQSFSNQYYLYSEHNPCSTYIMNNLNLVSKFFKVRILSTNKCCTKLITFPSYYLTLSATKKFLKDCSCSSYGNYLQRLSNLFS